MERRQIVQVNRTICVQRVVAQAPPSPKPQLALGMTKDGNLVLVRQEPQPDPADILAKAILLRVLEEKRRQEEEERKKKELLGKIILAGLLLGSQEDDDE